MKRILLFICLAMLFATASYADDMCEHLRDNVASHSFEYEQGKGLSLDFGGVFFGPCGAGAVTCSNDGTEEQGDFYFNESGFIHVYLFGGKYIFVFRDGSLLLLPETPHTFLRSK